MNESLRQLTTSPPVPDPSPPTVAFSPPTAWLDHLPASVFVILDGLIHYANRAAVALLEATSPNELLGRRVFDFVHPLDLHRILGRFEHALNSDVANPPTEFRGLTVTGRQLVAAVTSSQIEIDGRPGVLIAFMDMTEQAAMQARLQETDENFQRIMNTMQDVFYRTDAEGVTRYVCPAVKNVLGYSAEEIMGLPAAAFYPDEQEREALVQAIRTQGFVHDFPGRMRRKDGRVIDISISTHALRDDQGRYAGVEGIWRDITERKAMERELQRLATHDDLTGIANRRRILEVLAQAFGRGDAEHDPHDRRPFCALMIDLDHFKQVNDTHGHAAGDRALCHVVHLVETQIRTGDRFGRLGGEEFLLVLDDADRAAAGDVAERVRLAVRSNPLDLGQGAWVHLTVSIGIACWRPADERPTDLLERADTALYRAKDAGRDTVRTD